MLPFGTPPTRPLGFGSGSGAGFGFGAGAGTTAAGVGETDAVVGVVSTVLRAGLGVAVTVTVAGAGVAGAGLEAPPRPAHEPMAKITAAMRSTARQPIHELLLLASSSGVFREREVGQAVAPRLRVGSECASGPTLNGGIGGGVPGSCLGCPEASSGVGLELEGNQGNAAVSLAVERPAGGAHARSGPGASTVDVLRAEENPRSPRGFAVHPPGLEPGTH